MMRIDLTGNFSRLSDAFLALLAEPFYLIGSDSDDRLAFIEESATGGFRSAIEFFGSNLSTGPTPDIDAFSFGDIGAVFTDPLAETAFSVTEVIANMGGVFRYSASEPMISVDIDAFVRALANDNLEITGSSGRDVIGETALFNMATNDTIKGASGNDWISGGDGADTILGGRGRDKLFGDGNNDSLQGGSGKDRLFGGDNDDRLAGGAGKDRLFGEDGNDHLIGGGGRDLIDGGTGNDLMSGQAGRDIFVLRDGGGTDRVEDFRDGVDRLGVDSAGVMSQIDMRVEGQDLVLTLGDAQMRLLGAGTASLDADDFFIL